MARMGHVNRLETPLFAAKVDSVTSVAALFKSIAFCEKVNVFACDNGLKFTVEEGKYVQASVFIQKDMFQDFVLNEENISFKIPLKELLECLKIFCTDGRGGAESFAAADISTSSTTLKFSYAHVGSPFVMLLEENGVHTDFQLKTEDIDDLIEFELDPIVCKVILKAEPLRELLTEVDGNSPETVEIRVVPNDQVKISCKGVSGLMQVFIPQTCEAVELFDCTSLSAAHYRLSVLKYSFKALQLSSKVALKMDPTGILCLSFLLPCKTDSFVEFYCIPQIPDDEDMER